MVKVTGPQGVVPAIGALPTYWSALERRARESICRARHSVLSLRVSLRSFSRGRTRPWKAAGRRWWSGQQPYARRPAIVWAR
jgi:hypothetical protein